MHRTTEQFRQRYHRLPPEICERADKAFELLKSNPATLRFTSRRSETFGLPGLISPIALSRWKTEKTSFGFGSARMTNMNES